MLTPKLAFRNMLAHRQRSVVMLVVVAMVSCTATLFMAFSDGELSNFESGLMALSNPPSDIVVYAPGFKTASDQREEWKQLSSHSIKGYPAILQEMRTLPFVRRADTPTTSIDVDIIARGERHEKFRMRGVDPQHGWQVEPYLSMREGAFLDASDIPEIILHHKVASTFKARPGDTVTLTGHDLFGQIIAQDVRLAGFFVAQQDLPNIAETGFMNMAAYRLVSGFSADETMSLSVDVPEHASKASSIASLRRWASERKLDLEFWDHDALPAPAMATLDTYYMVRAILQVTSLILFTIVAFGVMTIVSANLYDRKREIGTYYCLGSEKGFLVRLYTLEILMLILVSTVTGVSAAFGLRQLVNSLGMTTEDSSLQVVFGGSHISLGFSAASVVFVVGSMLAVTLVTALTTLGTRLRVPPLAALREAD